MVLYLAGFGAPLLSVIEKRLFSFYHHKGTLQKRWDTEVDTITEQELAYKKLMESTNETISSGHNK